MEERKVSGARFSVDDMSTGDTSQRKNVTIPFTVSASEPNTIILHHPHSTTRSTLKVQSWEQNTMGTKEMTFPAVHSKSQGMLPEVKSQVVKSALPTTSKATSSKPPNSRLLSSTELISTNSFARCSKKVTDKGITFEIKAESKPKSKKTESQSENPPTASISHNGSTSTSKGSTSTSFQRTFYVPPGEDVQRATERVVSQITAELNKQAASQLAQGHTPDKETVIEITRIAAPGEGYFSRENMQKVSSGLEGSQARLDNKRSHLSQLTPEKTVHKTPTQDSVSGAGTLGDRTPSPPGLHIINYKQEPYKNVTLKTPTMKNEQAKFSGSSVQFKTKFNTTPISMPLISRIGSHSSVSSSNKRPLQLIVPQPRKICPSQTNTATKPTPPKLMSTAMIQNGRLQTVIQPMTTAATTVITSAAHFASAKESQPSFTPFLHKDKVVLKPGPPFPANNSSTKIKEEPTDIPSIPSSTSTPFLQPSASNSASIQPATTLHTVTLDGTIIKKEAKGNLISKS